MATGKFNAHPGSLVALCLGNWDKLRTVCRLYFNRYLLKKAQRVLGSVNVVN